MRTTLLPGLLGAVRGQPGAPGRTGRRVRAGARLPAEARRRAAGAGARPQGHRPAVAGRRARDAGHRALRPGEPARAGPAAPRPTDFFTHQGLRRAPAGRPRDRRRRRSSARASRTCTRARRPICCSAATRVGAARPAASRRGRALRHRGRARVRRRARRGAACRARPADRACSRTCSRTRRPARTSPSCSTPACRPRRCSSSCARPAASCCATATVFDVYEGDQVPPGKRSLAVRLVMRSPERTLTDKDIAGVRRKVLAALERELGDAALTRRRGGARWTSRGASPTRACRRFGRRRDGACGE